MICDETGAVRGISKGPGTNHWAIGIDECANRIVKMVFDAKEDAGIPRDRLLDSLVSVHSIKYKLKQVIILMYIDYTPCFIK